MLNRSKKYPQLVFLFTCICLDVASVNLRANNIHINQQYIHNYVSLWHIYLLHWNGYSILL